MEKSVGRLGFFVVLALMILFFSIGEVRSQLGFDNPELPRIPSPTQTSSEGGGNSSFNETLTNLLYWRLDGTNAPPTANWNMGGFEFTDVGGYTGTNFLNVTGSIRQLSSTSTGMVSLLDSGGASSRVHFGIVTDEDLYMEIGAFGGVNNLDTKDRDFRLWSSMGDAFYVDATNNNIGIGTTTPREQFEINGGRFFIDNALNDKIVINGTQVDPHTILIHGNQSTRFFSGINSFELLTLSNDGEINASKDFCITGGNCLSSVTDFNYNETLVALGFMNDSADRLNTTYAGFWYNMTGLGNSSNITDSKFHYNQTGDFNYNETVVALSFVNDSANRLNSTYADNWYNHSVANNNFNYNETLIVLGFVNNSYGIINATYADLWYNYTLVSLNFVNDSADRLNTTYAGFWYNYTLISLGFVNDSANRLNDTYAGFWYNQSFDRTNVAYRNNTQNWSGNNTFFDFVNLSVFGMNSFEINNGSTQFMSFDTTGTESKPFFVKDGFIVARDENAGDSTDSAQFAVGNKGTSQGLINIAFENANPATGQQKGTMSFQPRNSADSGAFEAGSIQMLKTSTVDRGIIKFSTKDSAGGFGERITIDHNRVLRFNVASADWDLQVQGNTIANLLYGDGGNDRIGINTSTPDALFEVDGNVEFVSNFTLEAFVNCDLETGNAGDVRCRGITNGTKGEAAYNNTDTTYSSDITMVYNLTIDNADGVDHLLYSIDGYQTGSGQGEWEINIVDDDNVTLETGFSGIPTTSGEGIFYEDFFVRGRLDTVVNGSSIHSFLNELGGTNDLIITSAELMVVMK